VAYLTVASFIFLAVVMAMMMIGNSQHKPAPIEPKTAAGGAPANTARPLRGEVGR
jgi:hypothetical protein